MKRPFLLRSASLRSFPRLASSLHRPRRLVSTPDLCDGIAQIRFSIKPLAPDPTCGLPHALFPLFFRCHRKFLQSYAPYSLIIFSSRQTLTVVSRSTFERLLPFFSISLCGLPHSAFNSTFFLSHRPSIQPFSPRQPLIPSPSYGLPHALFPLIL